jgi:hypothetical protein
LLADLLNLLHFRWENLFCNEDDKGSEHSGKQEEEDGEEMHDCQAGLDTIAR